MEATSLLNIVLNNHLMKIKCRLELVFEDEKTAQNVCDSLKPDDGDYIESRVEGNKIIAVAESDTILSLRSTIDDYLACVTLAQKAANREP